MKFAKPILIFIAVFFALFLIAIMIFTGLSSEQGRDIVEETHVLQESEEDSESNDEKTEAKEEILTVEETVNAFVAIIYDYDTSERAFYEGAEEYMTESAYAKLIPMQENEEPIDALHMISVLDEAKHYYREVAEEQVEVLSEVWYRVSGTGEYRIRQILKLKLVLKEQWLVQECGVLDTLEE